MADPIHAIVQIFTEILAELIYVIWELSLQSRQSRNERTRKMGSSGMKLDIEWMPMRRIFCCPLGICQSGSYYKKFFQAEAMEILIDEGEITGKLEDGMMRDLQI